MKRLGHLHVCHFTDRPQVAQALEESLGDSSFSEPQFPQIINSDLTIP